MPGGDGLFTSPDMEDTSAPFGTYAPAGLAETFRQLGHSLPPKSRRKQLASLFLRLAGGKKSRPFDVTVFGTEKARLWPAGNICEKRVFITPQYWEAEEREHLATHIRASASAPYVFVDAGANAGLYTLFVQSVLRHCGREGKFVCIEPGAKIGQRLGFNLDQSDIDAEVCAVALSDEERMVSLDVDASNMGGTKITGAEKGGNQVRALPLETLAAEAGLSRIDALKMDIEGHELPVLTRFFREAPTALLPDMILVEEIHEAEGGSLLALCEQAGYRLQHRTRMNLILQRP